MISKRRPPNALFKYFAPERFEDVLVKNMLRFTPPSVLNDPFDVYPFVTMGGNEGIRALIEQGRHEMRDSLNRAGQDANRLAGSEHLERDRVSFLVRAAQRKLLAMQESLRDTISKDRGLLCLSEMPDSILMWSHYAKNHSGFVVGFDTDAGFFHIHEEGFLFIRVVYSDVRPGFSRNADLDPEAEPFFVKSSDWKYEKEWRVVRKLKNASRVIGDGHSGVHLFQFPASIITQLIFGCNMPHNERVRITKVVKSNSQLRGISLLHAEPDAETFALNLIEDAEYRRVRFVHT